MLELEASPLGTLLNKSLIALSPLSSSRAPGLRQSPGPRRWCASAALHRRRCNRHPDQDPQEPGERSKHYARRRSGG